MADDSRVTVAFCPHCGRPLRCDAYFAAQGISPKLHFTCKCGRSHSLGELTAVHIAAEGLAVLMQTLEAYVEKHPDDREKAHQLAALLAKRGEAYAHHGDMKKAVSDFGRACTLDKENMTYRELLIHAADAVWGPEQINDALRQDDLNGAINMLFGFCARHPAEREALRSLAGLFNRRAVQAANAAQKLKERERLDFDEGSFVEGLEKAHLLSTSESFKDLSRNPAKLLHIAIADAAMASALAPDDSTIASNFDGLCKLAKQFDISSGDVKKIATRGREYLPNEPSKPKKRGLFSWLGGS